MSADNILMSVGNFLMPADNLIMYVGNFNQCLCSYHRKYVW